MFTVLTFRLQTENHMYKICISHLNLLYNLHQIYAERKDEKTETNVFNEFWLLVLNSNFTGILIIYLCTSQNENILFKCY